MYFCLSDAHACLPVQRLRTAFEWCERARATKQIKSYGIASWSCFRWACRLVFVCRAPECDVALLPEPPGWLPSPIYFRWPLCRVPPGESTFLSLQSVVKLAEQVGGSDHGFRRVPSSFQMFLVLHTGRRLS